MERAWQGAITEGVFRQGGRPGQAPPSSDMPTDYAVVAQTALEVARGVHVLHDRDIVHGVRCTIVALP